MSIKEDIQKVFRCDSCNLVPVINYNLNVEPDSDSDSEYEQKISIKCRNNHSNNDIDFEDFLKSYLKEENEKNKDSICQQHNKKIEKICKKCELNLCLECIHNCDGIIDIKEYSLSEKEKNDIKENFNKFEPFFNTLKKTISFYCNDKFENYYNINKKLLKFADIIFSTYLKYEKENNLSFEIIRNCRFCLKFKYKQLSLENDSANVIRSYELPETIKFTLQYLRSDHYESRKIDLYLKTKNYIIMPSNDIDISKFKLLKDYEIIIKSIKNSHFSSFTEFHDNKFAMVEKSNINIYKNDSLDILYTIEIDENIDYDDYDCEKRIPSLFTLQNNNLMAASYDGTIYIFKIMDTKYSNIMKFIVDEKILGAIELKNRQILVFTKNRNVIIYYFNKKTKKYEIQITIKIQCNPQEIYRVKLVDCKDSENIMIITREEMGYLNYKKGKYEKKIVCSDSWYGFDVAFFRKNLLLEANMNLYIRDKKCNQKSFVELHESYQYDADVVYELKDGSFLCGMSNKYNNILRQYAYCNNNIFELSKLSFAGYKDNFEFIYQLKNGNIIGSLSNEEYFMLK